MSRLRSVPVTIANGETTSGAASLGGEALVAVVTPSTWTAQDITFLVSFDGGTTYVALVDGGGVDEDATYTVTAPAASRYIALPIDLFVGCTHVKVVSGAAQAGSDILTLITRPVA
jgi:hypothetical protein